MPLLPGAPFRGVYHSVLCRPLACAPGTTICDRPEAAAAERRTSAEAVADRADEDPHAEPAVHYLIDPFRDYTLHFAEAKITLNVADLLTAAGQPC